MRKEVQKSVQKIHFDTIDSTNTFARENADNLTTPVLITAYEQTKGRGRHGKSFFSPDSGIYFSLLFEADPSFDLITPAAAVCTCKALKEICGIDADIKWVNDIFYNGKKVCGILTERFISNNKTYTIVGIGINLNTKEFPADLPQAGCLGVDIEGRIIAERVAELLLQYNSCYERENILKEYKNKLFIIGKEIDYELNGVIYSGICADINNECNLIVKKPDGDYITLKSGEISIKVK